LSRLALQHPGKSHQRSGEQQPLVHRERGAEPSKAARAREAGSEAREKPGRPEARRQFRPPEARIQVKTKLLRFSHYQNETVSFWSRPGALRERGVLALAKLDVLAEDEEGRCDRDHESRPAVQQAQLDEVAADELSQGMEDRLQKPEASPFRLPELGLHVR